MNVIDTRTGEIIHTVYLLSNAEEITDEEVFELAIDCGHNSTDEKYWKVLR